MSPRTRLVSVALAATLLISACGSDGDEGAGSEPDATIAETTPETTPETTLETTPETTPETTESTPESTETTVAEQDVDADSAAAEAALLTIADFPDGWSENAPAADTASEIDALLAACIGLDEPSAGAAAATGEFSSPDGNLVVSERIDVRATERDARLTIGQLTNPEVPACIAAAYTELGASALSTGAVPEGVEIGEVVATRLAVGAAGDSTQAIRLAIAVTDGAVAPLTVDQVFTRVGRSLAVVTFEGRSEPTAVETIDEIAAVAASRLPV